MTTTFNINQHGITVKDEFGDKTMIRTSSAHYAEAKEAVMSADWNLFYCLATMDEMDEVIAEIDETEEATSIPAFDFDDVGPRGKILVIGSGMSGLLEMFARMTDDFIVAVDDSPEFEANDQFASINDAVDTIKGLMADGLISAEDLITPDNLDQFADAMPQSSASHEHDLSNWNGSPIFYPTREMARAQSDRWGMFWEYHDFGIASPPGYRYATVPRGVGPTAPEGYDWVCLPREE